MAYTLKDIKLSPFPGLTSSRVTSDFGPRSFWNPITQKQETNFHHGIDMTSGTTIVAIADGKVASSRNNIKGYTEKYASGNYVTIYHGNGIYTTYCHMVEGSVKVKAGDKVVAGTVLGTKGSTGHSTGPHLHFGVRVNGNWTDPKPYLLGQRDIGSYKANSEPTPTPEPKPTPGPVGKFNIGDKVIINGPLYVNSNAANPSGHVNDKITNITRRNDGSAHPYNTTGDLGWMDESSIRKYEEPTPTPTPEPKPVEETFKVGDKVKPTKLVNYNGTPLRQYDDYYTISEIKGDRAVLTATRNGKPVVWAAMNTKNITHV